MSIEEKAKAYDEALERARKYMAKGYDVLMPEIFPELRESEDERIRKEIIEYLKLHDKGENDYAHPMFSKWFAWLEKQKEQKPISFNEPYNPDEYEVVMEGNATNLKRKEQKSIESIAAEVTKDKESAIKFLKSAGIMDDNGELAEMYRSEQKPADYDHEMWKNCEANFEGGKKEVIDHPEKYGLQKEQKPTMIQWTGKNLKEVIDFTGKSQKFGAWFKSWEDYENYVHSHGDIFKLFRSDGSHFEVPVGAWIIKTPDGYNIPSRFRFIQKPTEWSEEDEQHLNSVCSYLDAYIQAHEKDSYGVEECKYLKHWLKSLRPSWKPSKEQMKALGASIVFHKNDPNADLLRSLYDDLQKIR